MTSSLPPQGDRFEDQYTSATADLSAAGVATAVQAEIPRSRADSRADDGAAQRRAPRRPRPGRARQRPRWSATSAGPWPIRAPSTSASPREPRISAYALHSREHESQTLLRPRYVTVGAGVLLAVAQRGRRRLALRPLASRAQQADQPAEAHTRRRDDNRPHRRGHRDRRPRDQLALIDNEAVRSSRLLLLARRPALA